jgi:hypothetical protein
VSVSELIADLIQKQALQSSWMEEAGMIQTA